MRIAIIGAGAAGLVTARECRREGLHPVVFDHAARPGGTWVYDPNAGPDLLDTAPAGTRARSPLYPSLRTNLPRDLMAFGDVPFDTKDGGDPRRFPGHAEVLRYLDTFRTAFELDSVLRLEAEVTQVEPRDHADAPWRVGAPRPPSGWAVRWTHAERSHEERFDAVAVCNGHFHRPRIPVLPGVHNFEGRVLHSHAYRDPQAFAGLTVALLGAKASGVDLSRELATVARRVLLCARGLPRIDGTGPRANLDQRPAITAIERTTMHLGDGTRESGIDALILCTGYHYAFEFLDPAAGLLEDRPDRVFPLYLDLVSAHAARLAFVGLPFQVVPFPLFEHQARLWARSLAGRVPLPDTPTRLALAHHREARFAAAGVPLRHRLRYGESQFRYCAGLAALADDDPPPPWRASLYAAVQQARHRDPLSYRDIPLPTIADLTTPPSSNAQ